ncbi:MAG: hypothetical protein ACLT8H_02120 [Streptococcus parasanguinis]
MSAPIDVALHEGTSKISRQQLADGIYSREDNGRTGHRVSKENARTGLSDYSR